MLCMLCNHLHLHLRHLANAFIQSELLLVHLSEERETTIYRRWYSKDVHRNKCQALELLGYPVTRTQQR